MTEPETQTEPEVTEGGTTVDIPPDPPPKDDEPAEKQTRAERRAAKGQSYAEEARQAREEARQAREHAQRIEVEMAELRGRVSAGPKAPDPAETELAALDKEVEAVVARMGKGDESAVAEWHRLRRRESAIVARQAATDVEARITKSMPAPLDARASALLAEFPSLQDNEAFKAVANGHVNRLVATEGRDMKNPEVRYATLREGAALAARELKIGGAEKREPTDRDRARIAGTGSGDSGASNGKQQVHMSAAQMRLSRQWANAVGKGDLTDEEAATLWWKNIGHKAAKKS